jgi:hypothetical protein
MLVLVLPRLRRQANEGNDQIRLTSATLLPANRATFEQPQHRDDEVKTGGSELVLKLRSCFVLFFFKWLISTLLYRVLSALTKL